MFQLNWIVKASLKKHLEAIKSIFFQKVIFMKIVLFFVLIFQLDIYCIFLSS